MIDLKRTLGLISGGMLNAEETWRDFLPDAASWQKTALLLTVPLIVLGAVGAYLVALLASGVSMFGPFRPTLVSTLMTLISSAVAAGVVAFVFSAMAGALGGKNNFSLALAATSFAFIPGYISQAIMWLPWIGGLIALGLFVYGMILLWKIIPMYLGVPDGKRSAHYILSLLVSIVAMFILSVTIGRALMPSVGGPGFSGISDVRKAPGETAPAVFTGIARQGELLAAAEEDRYDPPRDGRLSKNQVREFVRVMQRTEELHDEKMAELKALTEKAEKNENLSLRDLGSMMEGAAEVTGLPTSEIEIVKSAGGNWAEHQWVRESLRTARIQKDINDAVVHNYALYQEFEDELSGISGL